MADIKTARGKVAAYSILHFLIDAVCAYAMFGRFMEGNGRLLNILVYNFCAFALQMPLGALLDYLIKRRSEKDRESQDNVFPDAFVTIGELLTLCGALIHPAVLGTGNAFFHAGAGVYVMQTDERYCRKGRMLGVFVAPGAMGIFLGGFLGRTFPMFSELGKIAFYLMIILVFVLRSVTMWLDRVSDRRRMAKEANTETTVKDGNPALRPCQRENVTETTVKGGNHGIFAGGQKKYGALLIICCFAVVVLRSAVGLRISFDWNNTFVTGLTVTLAVVLGKMAGGFTAAGTGSFATSFISLLPAAVLFCFPGSQICSLIALFCFNMTMPVTLYILYKELPGQKGFVFGLLTFGLFLGALPSLFGTGLFTEPEITACVGCMLSLALLTAVTRKEKNKQTKRRSEK